jgi:hypothetical protein
MRSPRSYLIAGLLCLVLAQVLASGVLTTMRSALVPNRDVYSALKPGEFAGTLMLGGFRGLACDLLWMRALQAKEQGHFYESVALGHTISQIQPRFEQIWEYMAWDMAYNIAYENDDENVKWAWFLAGLEVNATGCLRNPQSERLLRHLAWMFHHKGDDFRDRVEHATWARLINPVLAQVNDQLPPDRRLELLPEAPGLGNFQLSELLYSATLRLAEVRHLQLHPYVRRMVAIAIERDGNRRRNRGEHLAALRRYLAGLKVWEEITAWCRQPALDEEDRQDREAALNLSQHNEGRLRRKAVLLVRQLATDPEAGERTAKAIDERRWAEAERELASAGAWQATVSHGRLRWLDEQP